MNQEEYNILGLKINKTKFSTFIKVSALIGLLLLIFVSILILNHSVLLSPDDYNYTFVQGSNVRERVDSLENCIKTGKFFYQNWTGRVIPHVLIGIFRSLNPNVYEIVNSLVFMLFIVLCYILWISPAHQGPVGVGLELKIAYIISAVLVVIITAMVWMYGNKLRNSDKK